MKYLEVVIIPDSSNLTGNQVNLRGIAYGLKSVEGRTVNVPVRLDQIPELVATLARWAVYDREGRQLGYQIQKPMAKWLRDLADTIDPKGEDK